MRLLAIDPGQHTSGVVLLHCEDWPPRLGDSWSAADIDQIRYLIDDALDIWLPSVVVVEWLVPYLKSGVLGATTLDTARMVGRIQEIADDRPRMAFYTLTRPEVGRLLCPCGGGGVPTGSQMAEAIRDIYRRAGRATGGGADPVRGTKRQPGPLHGLALSSHAGSALAVGLAHLIREGAAR